MQFNNIITKSIREGFTPFSKLILLASIALFSVLVFLFTGSVLSSFLYGVNILNISGNSFDIADSNVLSAFKLLQAFQHLGLFIIPPVVFAYLVSMNPGSYLGFKKQPVVFSLLCTGIIMLVSMPLINWLLEINETLSLPEFMSAVEQWMKESEENAAKFTKAFLKMDTWGDLWINLLIIALIPAIGEELLFRGVIQRLFSEWTNNVHLGIIISAILFSAMHMQFYGFLPRMMLGVLFGYLLIWSNTLWLPIFGHFINNGSAVLFTFLNETGVITFDTDNFGTGEQEIFFPFVSAGIIAGLLLIIYRRGKMKR